MIAGYAKAFGMQVMVWGSEKSRAAAVADGLAAAPTREAFFEQADVVTLHLRLNDATRGIVTADDLARMKRDALFVNTSRAELVEEGALEAALRKGHPGQAALDVFTSEPLAADAPILKIPTVLATPHLGYVERDSYELYFRAALENVVQFANGNPTNILNAEVLS
jgi:D-3-phosphoglycerate dehydrogenase